MKTNDYLQFTKYFRENILFSNIVTQQQDPHLSLDALTDGKFTENEVCNAVDWNNGVHRSMIRRQIMLAAHMVRNEKAFQQSERIAKNMCRQFYIQGDAERKMGFRPTLRYDSERCLEFHFAHMNVIRYVCTPCFDLLRRILPKTKPLYDNCK